MKKIIKGIVLIILFITLGIVTYNVYDIYETNNFKDYKRSVGKQDITTFKRDNQVRYSKERSFKIESPEYNDAMLSKTLKLEKNKSYKISCMVKTEDVESEHNKVGSGAHLSIEGVTSRSMAITGTTDWQKIELIFNSKKDDELTVGIRLGGNIDDCKGTAWFSDFKLEEGVQDTSNSWKFACFIYKSTDVTLNEKNIKLSVTDKDVSDIKETIKRFQDSCITLSNRKMSAQTDVYLIDKPLSSLSYDDTFGYCVLPEDVEKDIKPTIDANDYDHIFVVMRLGDDKYKDDIEVNDWIGLGSMDYYGIGFSNIRLPNSSKSYVYKYDSRINAFPEEVLLHEFLHSLERSSKEYGYQIPALHDYQQYGYKNEKLIGQKYWYQDYMNCNINSNGTKIGLPKEIYNLKPAKQSDFKNTYESQKIFE